MLSYVSNSGFLGERGVKSGSTKWMVCLSRIALFSQICRDSIRCNPKAIICIEDHFKCGLTGSLVYLLGTAAFALPGNQLAYLSMLVFAAGMFTLHSVLSALLNHLERDRKGLINGLYVSAYYCGGALGSYFPGFLYQRFGWLAFILLLLLLQGVLIVLSVMLRNAEKAVQEYSA